YRLYRDDYGWNLPSIALSVGNQLGYQAPDAQNVLLNWRGKPFTYQNVSFSDVLLDMTSKEKTRPPNEFTGKIVIIGSTAPSLFDLKATPTAKIFPGVEILATAIDNVKHGDYLHVWHGALTYVLLSLLLIWLTTFALYRDLDRDKINRIFSGSQIGLLVVSYIGINLTDTYIDLSGPVFWAVMYFSVAKLYALATDRALQRGLAFGGKAGAGGTQVLIMPVLVESIEPLDYKLLKKLKRQMERASRLSPNIDFLRGTQTGIWGLFGDLILVSWTYAGAREEDAARAGEDAERLAGQLSAIVRRVGLPGNTEIRYAFHKGGLAVDRPPADQWRGLFVQAVLKL
ncbi:MAG: CHASE2 domain-containing protein, partial [Desulfobacteraceae bacterium]